MKKISLLICAILATATSSFSQVTQAWASTYGRTPTSDDQTADFALDINGNTYITGYSYGTNGDYATVMYNSSGIQQWAAVYAANATSDDHPTAIALDPAGNVYVTGYSFSGTNYNYLTVKYNNVGVQQWAVSYNGTGNGTDEARDIVVDAAGNSYVTGRSQGANANFVTVKYNTNGLQQWASTYNGPGNNFDDPVALAIDGSGNTYVTGATYTGSQYNYATVMYNTAGTQQWATIYNGSGNGEDRATDITIDAIGNTYVTGFSFNGTNNDFATVKYNSAGVQTWVAIFNGGTDRPNAIAVDLSGNVYVSGYMISSNWIAVTYKYDANGVAQWARQISGPNGYYYSSITTDITGNVYAAGYWGGYTFTERINPTNGTAVWQMIYGPAGNEYGIGIGVDGSNNVYVGTSRSNSGNNDMAVVKYAPVIPLSATPTQTNLTCFLSCNGTASVVASGGTAPYTYLWSPSGGTAATATSLCSGTYSCTITDNSGATTTQTFLLTQPTAVNAAATATSILCNGGNASVTVAGSGGTAPYTGTGTFTVTAGTYSYTVTDANGCANTTSINVTQPTALTAAANATSILCNGGTATVTVVGSGGTAPYTGTGTFTVTAGTYSYTVTDANGCTNTTSITVSQPTALTASANATSILCNGGTATVAVVGSGGTAPYTGTGTFTVTAGTYSYTVTDANGCANTTSITVTQPTALTAAANATSILCNGGTATVAVVGSGGNAPYTGTGTFTVTAGTYSYTVTDANGCANTTSITVTQPTALTATSNATSILCNGGTTTVVVGVTGGTSPYTGTGTFTVTAGTYSYTVTDANGCSNTTSITVTEPTALSVAATATSISCNGGNATVTVVGAGGTAPYTGEGTFTVTAGTYSYTVTDANGCTVTTSITVTEPIAVWSIATPTHVTCFLGADGSIDLNPVGGTPGYTYDWNNGQYTTEDLSGIVAGVYSVLITDANGCSYTDMVTVLEPAQLIATVTSVTDPSGCGATNGSIDITVSGGTVGYSYLWSNAPTTEDLTGVGAGAYSCVVTDTNGCTANVSSNLNDPNAPTVTFALAVDTLCSTDAAFTLTGESPAGGTFSGPGVTAGSFDPAAAGVGMHMISYTFTDINGCTGSTTDSIFVDVCTYSDVWNLTSEFSIYPNPNDGTFTIQTTSVADVMIYDAQGKLVYTQKVQSSSLQIKLGESGMYMVTVIDANGARTSQRVMVTK